MLSTRTAKAAWLTLAALLLGGVGAWSAALSGSIEHPKLVAAVPSPPPVRSILTVVTEYPGQVHLTAAQLCAKVAPDFNSVIVDDTLGFVIANIHC